MIQRWRTLPPYWRRVTLRLALLPLILFVLYSALFVLLETIHEPFTGVYVGLGVTEEQIDEIKDDLGLNDSPWVKYQRFWRNAITLDFGVSFVNGRSVRDILQQRWPTSVQLLLMASAIGVTAALATAQAASTNIGRRAIMVIVPLLAAAPVFYVAYEAAVLLSAEWWYDTPPVRQRIDFFSDPWGNLKQFGAASLMLGVAAGVWSSRTARTPLSATPSPARSRIARAAGVALIDMLPFLLTAFILVEWAFTMPGLGAAMFQAAVITDIYLLEAMLMLVSLVAVFGWVVRPSFDFSHRGSPSSSRSLRQWIRNPLLAAGAAMAVVYVILGIIGPWIAPYDPLAVGGRDEIRETPSWDHWFGTDYVSRDTLSLVLDGNRGALEFTLLVIGAGFLPGIILGLATTFAAKRASIVSTAMHEFACLLRALPVLPLLFLLVATFDQGRSPTVAAVAILVFALGLQVALHRALTPASLAGGLAMAAAISLSANAIIGAYRLDSDLVSWGSMVVTPFQHTPVHHTAAVFPALAITIFTAGFLLIRTALDDLDPPRLHER